MYIELLNTLLTLFNTYYDYHELVMYALELYNLLSEEVSTEEGEMPS